MGLKWDASKEYRLGPDGKPFTIVFEFQQRMRRHSQVLVEYWKEIGIHVVAKEVARSVYDDRRQANEVDMAVWSIENTEFTARRTGYATALPPWTGNCYPWELWINTNGAQGEEPPDDIKRAAELRDRWVQTLPGTDEYMKLGKEIASIPIKGLHRFGAIGIVPYPVVITNKVGNRPKVTFWSPSYQQWVPYKIAQWYFK
jgi:peptide/nickel transport system substrate-binding protein